MRVLEVIEYHEKLNPKLYGDRENLLLNKDVRKQLLKIADSFLKFIDLPKMKVEDIILTGSNANYNWTAQSDVDLHLIVDYKSIEKDCKFISAFFTDKKTLWNQNHDVTIHGHQVEVYVQDANEKHVATGIYSVQNDEWIKKPTYNKPSSDDSAVAAKANHIKCEIDHIISTRSENMAIQRVKEKIRNMRKTGLTSKGEFSTENLAFKELRKSGYLEKLNKYKVDLEDKELSLEGLVTAVDKPYFKVEDPDNQMEKHLAKYVPEIYGRLRAKYGEPVGEGRNRVTFGRGNIVIKVPKNELGMHDNAHEASTYRKYKGRKEDIYARSKIVHIFDIPILLMIHVDTKEGLKKEGRPWWADFVDSLQVGVTRKGEWKAYDYGWN